jgi:hypothetical protein
MIKSEPTFKESKEHWMKGFNDHDRLRAYRINTNFYVGFCLCLNESLPYYYNKIAPIYHDTENITHLKEIVDFKDGLYYYIQANSAFNLSTMEESYYNELLRDFKYKLKLAMNKRKIAEINKDFV